ncbi:uncharacterized protein LOC120328247 [Styela clava]|uniref:uncharacterized protein LOC120328247 n=1 Tax=Styela clava TaxID=7725 RepID=UPI0019395B59|nr:uncharacterized protein LOC120328247 [Styela clava]
MILIFGVVYLVLYAVVSYYTLQLGLFDSSYRDDERINSMLIRSSDVWAAEWCKVHMLLTACSAVILIRGWRKTQHKKITVLDFFFLFIFIGLTLMESVGMYLNYRNHLPDITLPNDFLFKRIARLNAFSDWASLPLLGWIIAWSRHVRRGWYPKRNRLVFAASVTVFFLAIIHPTAYVFGLSVVGVLSCIALYECYKVHFYRPGIKAMFWISLLTCILFCLIRISSFVFKPVNWIVFYFNVLSLASTTTTVSLMYLRILENVNEHKK